jgi:hypothetical protein
MLASALCIKLQTTFPLLQNIKIIVQTIIMMLKKVHSLKVDAIASQAYSKSTPIAVLQRSILLTAGISENHRLLLFALIDHIAMIEKEHELELAGFRRVACKGSQLMSLIT